MLKGKKIQTQLKKTKKKLEPNYNMTYILELSDTLK